MQFFPRGRVYDFMKLAPVFGGASLLLVIASVVLLVYPGPRLGTDFIGGTELELAFEKAVSTDDIQQAVERAGISRPDVIEVEDGKLKNHYLLRVQEVATIPEATQESVRKRLCFGETKPEGCVHHATEVKFSPGGEKISVRFAEEPDLSFVKEALSGGKLEIRPGENNPSIQNSRDHRVEVQLLGMGERIMDALTRGLGADTVPDSALRVEWVGPKAGAQLRDSAIKSVIITIVFILIYVAFRFDLRFAPGGILSLVHDAIGTLGILVLLGKEMNLTTVAAILTLVAYSVNDTVVVYDRIRENLPKHRGASFESLINLSTSEMLGRTLLTGGTTILALLCFFVWGTGALKDFALTMTIGMVLGIYSSVYVALPLTAWLDRRFFAPLGGAKKRA